MLQINKEESFLIREKLPDVRITITNAHSNHKKYYAPEEPKVLRLLNRFREQGKYEREGRNGRK